MTDTPQSRAERRREAREQWKKHGGLTPEPTVPAQWPLLLASTGFLFSCLCFSIIGGMKLWTLPALMPKIVGWTGIVMVLLASFETWRRFRARFVWRKRWTFYFTFSFFAALGLAVLWTTAIEQWQAREKFEQFLSKHSTVISTSEQWLPGTAWSSQQCAQQEQYTQTMLKELFRGKAPPAVNEVGVLISIQQVSYQAGCEDQWNDMKNFMLNMPASWEGQHPRQQAAVFTYLNQKWPNSFLGCQMEYSRAKSLKEVDDQQKQVFEMLCQQAQIMQEQVWAPGFFTERMKVISSKTQ